MRAFIRLLLPACCLLAAACQNELSNKSHGPISMGDSATIITESDASKLQDGIADIKINTGDEDDSDAAPARQDTAHAATQPAAMPAGPAISAAFKEVTVFVTSVTSREKSKDLSSARAASFTLNDGNLAGASLKVSGGTVSKVSQRYSTIVSLQDGADKLVLDKLGTNTGWQPLQGNGGAYPLSDLSAEKLQYKNTRPAEIRAAVQEAARRKRLSRKDTQDWLDAVKNIRAANQPPCVVTLKNVSWRIEGKDAAGKAFSKEVRIDVPM